MKQSDSNIKTFGKPDNHKKNARIQFMTSSDDDILIERAAEKSYLDKSAFCRRAILKECEVVLKQNG